MDLALCEMLWIRIRHAGDAKRGSAFIHRFEWSTGWLSHSDRVGDLAIPRGSTVVVFIYAAHHSPRYWENPENFDSERFTKANEMLYTPGTWPDH